MKSKFFKSLMLLLILILFMVPGVSAKPASGETVDIIILADGATDALADKIISLGGVVNYQYSNVAAIAASIPVEVLGKIAGFAGVTSVQKDVLVNLPEEVKNDDEHPKSYVVEDMEGIEMQTVDPAMMASVAIPEGYANFQYTGAPLAWEETLYGEGTIVAVVDTGTVPNVCLSHAVIGAPGFPEGYNASGDGIPATDPSNYYHGTHVGGVIASACTLSIVPNSALGLAISAYLPWDLTAVPILGQAPLAQLYPVKVFPASGAGVPSSVILDGLDHVLTLKKGDLLDIDIVNMSLGGPTLWDGRDAYDRFIEELVEADILVVTSAGNEGPTPNSVGSPATSFGAVSVGALDYALSSRVFYEYLGLRYMGVFDQGLVMRSTAETRVANFSSRGPLSDGRFGPEISALGHWTFFVGPVNELRWASGTSFSAPTVAGGAALLNAWWEAQGIETDPTVLEEVLFLGADPDVVDESWQGINDQGYGALDVPASLDYLTAGNWKFKPAKDTGSLTANVLGKPVPGKVQSWESETITVGPSEKFDAVFEINEATSKVTIEVYDVVTPDNSAYAFWPNSLEVHLQSAKRTAFDDPVAVYWYPQDYGDAFDIVVEDGMWTFWDIPWDYQPMEPGLMKLSLIGDYSNEAPVSFKVRITRENFREPLSVKNRVANAVIKMADAIWYAVEIPEGTTTATFDLTWVRDWSKFPTSDIDMIIFDPTFALASVDGATGNAPERAVLYDPMPGTWYVLVDGYEVNKSDYFNLYLTLE
ncbi:MAG: S8 family serine peptidase [Chloroflexota bacterium]|nr:S8 family serine peptidase [Chloroflexota bacterium]